MKKGAAIPQLSEILIMVLMLLFFLLLLTSVFSAFGSNEQGVVRLNAELLRSKMGEACSLLATGSGSVRIDRLSFPQNTPYPTAAHRLIDVPGFLAKTYIKLTADPKYVLYYEAFPVGEAVGWEVYHDFDYRIIAPFDYSKRAGSDDGPINYIDFEREEYKGERSFVTLVKEAADKKGIKSSSTTVPLSVVVNNIILNSQLNPIPNEDPRQFAAAKISRSGEWKRLETENTDTKAKEGDNTFEFSSYVLLTALEKTSLKYRSCGDNSLCLKTADGVERLKLPQSCDNIKYVQLEYDARNLLAGNTIAIGGAAIIVGGAAAAGPGAIAVTAGGAAKAAGLALARGIVFSVTNPIKTAIISLAASVGLTAATATAGYALGKYLSFFLSYKSSDFYLASPCIAQGIEIQKVSCQTLCNKWMSYPLYEVTANNRGERQYVKAGDHYQCMENIDGVQNLNVSGPQGDCLKVKVKNTPEGFCWTADPTKGFNNGFFESLSNWETQTVASIFGFTPVKDSALYIDSTPAIALKPSASPELSLGAIKDFLERRYTWSWPGSGERIKPQQPSTPAPGGSGPQPP